MQNTQNERASTLNKTSPFLTCFPYRRSPSAYFEGTHGVRSAWGNTRRSHKKVSSPCYITRSRAKKIHTRPFTCTYRQARRSLRSPPCGSNSVCEITDSVYKYALTEFSF